MRSYLVRQRIQQKIKHISLKELYKILLADQGSGLGTISAGKSIMRMETSRVSPKSEKATNYDSADIYQGLVVTRVLPPSIVDYPFT